MSLHTRVVRLAAESPKGSVLRRDLLAAAKAAQVRYPDYLPKGGKKKLLELEKLISKLPKDRLAGRMHETVKSLMYSVDRFYDRGERFKPQVSNIVDLLGTIRVQAMNLANPSMLRRFKIDDPVDAKDAKKIEDLAKELVLMHHPLHQSMGR